MNSADKRIEELLNRAGQTISDLPEPNELSFAYSGKLEEAYSAAMTFSKGVESKEYGYTELMLSDYIMHLTDIIDRLEWALDNVCGERDYLEKRLADVDCDCDICVYADVNEAEMPCYQCDIPPAEKHFEFAGIPEDWRGDDN